MATAKSAAANSSPAKGRDGVCRECLKRIRAGQDTMVVYLTTGEKGGPGKLYQVTKKGKILGIVDLPDTATGLAMHGNQGLVAAVPDGRRQRRLRRPQGQRRKGLRRKQADGESGEVAVTSNPDMMIVADTSRTRS